MLKKLSLIFYVFLFSCLFSNESDPFEMVDFGGEPSAIVQGCVNVISGDFIVNRHDLIVKGQEPICIPIHYSQRNVRKTYGGWDFGENYFVAKLLHYDKLEIFEKSGIRLAYRYDEKLASKDDGQKHSFKLYGKIEGWTNTFLGDISARMNPLNNVVYVKPSDPKEIIVEAPDGTVRYYRAKVASSLLRGTWEDREIKPPIEFYLQSESLPNGNCLIYAWENLENKRWRVKEITSKSSNGKTLAWVKVHYEPGDDKHRRKLTFETSSHQTLIYDFQSHCEFKHKRISVLREANYPNRPFEKYGYWVSKKKDFYPELIQGPNRRELKVAYYEVGNHSETNTTILNKQALGDLRYTRVKALYQPIGKDSEPLCSHLFAYLPGKYKQGGGTTDVLDAHQNLTRYFYNQYFVITRIEKWLKSDHLLFSTNFEWTDKNWLKRKTLLGANNELIFSTQYEYDPYGNIVQEDFSGNLSGSLKEDEHFCIQRSYYPNHLLKKEVFPNGKTIEYSYLGNSSLLTAKLISDQYSRQRLRTFYFYDDAILVHELTDDGSTNDPNNLAGVTKRLIKRITPNTGEFLYGMPHVIEDKYLDLETREEILLKKRVIHYEQKDKGNISRIDHYDAEDRYAYSLDYFYDEKERLVAQTDPYGRKRILEYDDNYNLKYDQDPNEDFELHQSHDLMNRPLLTTQLSSGGKKRESQNRYNLLSQKIAEIDFRGNETRYAYDPVHHPIKIELPPLLEEDGNFRSPIIQKTYNPLGNVLSKQDPEGNITQTLYTSRGKPYQIIHPDGAIDSFTYDLSGNLLTCTSPEGILTAYTYDFLDRITCKKVLSLKGEVLSEEYYTYDAFNLLTKTDPDGVVTTFSYDGANRLIQRETLAGQQKRLTLHSYDSFGRLHKTIHCLNGKPAQVFVNEYDLLGRVTEEREEDANQNVYSTTAYHYDDFSNRVALIKEVQVGESVERLEYDPFRRLIKAIDPLSNVTTIDYEDECQNGIGQATLKKTTTNPNGTQTVEIFDAHDNLSILEKISPTGELLLREEFFYNLNQQKTRQVSTLFSPHKIIIKSWSYNSRSQLVELHEAAGESIEKITCYTYTPDGYLKEMIKPDGTLITYTYDGLGRQNSIKTSDGTCHYVLTYDKMGNIIQSEDLIHQTAAARNYSHFGELLHERLSNQQCLSSVYDDLGRRTALIFADDSELAYTYDPYHLKNITRLSKDGAVRYEHNYLAYDKSHHLVEEKSSISHSSLIHSIDLMGRRIETDGPYSREKISRIDPNGNILEYQRFLPGSAQEVSHYTYDALDQLTHEAGLFSHDYRYDAHHNRLQKDQNAYHVNALHELVSHDEACFNHDQNGNRISEASHQDEVTYVYDGLDRLTEIKWEKRALRFRYDSWDRLITIHMLSLSRGAWVYSIHYELLYDDQNELGNFPLLFRILGQGRGAEIGATLAIETWHTVYFPAHDLFGNIIALLNSSNEPLESYRFSAFGEEITTTHRGTQLREPFNPWRYQSKQKIAHLIHFGRRFYDPATARWLSPDPKGFTDSPNPYQYLLNNPLQHLDFYGEEVQDPDWEKVSSQVRIDDNFEGRAPYSRSFNYTYSPDVDYSLLEGHPIMQGTKAIGFTGGINNDFQYDHMENLKLTSKYAGNVPIESTYNATQGFRRDIQKCNKAFHLVGTTAAVMIRERWMHFFSKAPEEGLYLDITHSGGTAQCFIAALLTPKEYRDRIIAVAIAPEIYLPKSLFKDAYNYQSTHDFVPHLQKFFKTSDLKNAKVDVRILPRHRDAPGFDHAYRSPTYKESIVTHIDDFLRGVYE